MNHQALKLFKSGEIIIKQGESGNCAYIIEDGRVEIIIETGDKDNQFQHVGTRGAGSMVGEMAIVDSAPRIATIRAIEDCRLFEITQEDFARRLDSADPVLKLATQVILTRYRDLLARSDIRSEERAWLATEALEKNYAVNSDALKSIKMASDFDAALGNKEVSLHYQPIVDLKTQKTNGFEALMRWTHPVKGPISPSVFIPVIEESGLIVKASQWALRESMAALKRMQLFGRGDDSLFMSVNFSSHDFASDGFVETLYETISKTDIKTECVHLEITERLLIGQPDHAREVLNMCKQAGIGISIDDFGTGYSSLGYLHYFPIDTLKIDRSFVKNMGQDKNALELIRSIVALGKNLNMHIIAEGIETKEEALTLRDMGCDMAQGYYFSKPMPENEIMTFLRENKPYDL